MKSVKSARTDHLIHKKKHGRSQRTTQRGTTDERVAAVSLKLPPLWTADPLVWFAQIESQFATRRITSLRTKYEYVVASLTQNIAMEVRDILISLPANQPFSILKEKLLLRTTVSEQRKLQTLLTTVELGDRTPSQLLREMQGLLWESVQQIDQALIRELFLQRIPPSIGMILASTGPDISLYTQATLADKMMEVSPSLNNINTEQTRQQTAANSANISTVVARPGTQQADMQDLKMQMALLTQKVVMLMCNPTGGYREPRTRQRERSQTPRQSSQSGNRNQGTRYPFRNDVWYYHFKFGDEATKCEGPCKMNLGNVQARH